MHAEAMYWLREVAKLTEKVGPVCEFGALNVNGSALDLFLWPDSHSVGVDLRPGSGVNVVADAADYGEPGSFMMVLCTEVLEHTPRQEEVCRNAYRILMDGGYFVSTMAGIGRPRHSSDGGLLKPGEFYRNVAEYELRKWLAPFRVVLTQVREDDLYVLAVK